MQKISEAKYLPYSNVNYDQILQKNKTDFD